MRKPRALATDAKYHITARANRQEMIFYSTMIKKLFLNTIERAKKKYKFSIYHFCIMGNHIHFILQPHKNENLSRIMQWVLSVFAKQFNTYFKIKGHVWYDRFVSKIIENMRQFITTFNYISQNPVKADIVSNQFLYEYSGIWHYRNHIFHIIDPPNLFLQILFPILSSKYLLLH